MAARTLILMAGLPGTGKTTLATALAAQFPAILLNKDVIRAALFPPDRIEYRTQQDDLVMDVMLRTAEYLFVEQEAPLVIIDGRTFSRRYQIELCAAWAERLNATLKIIECWCSDAVAQQRLTSDASTHLAANRDFALFQEIRARFEPITRPKLVVDTDQPVAVCVEQCAEYILPSVAIG